MANHWIDELFVQNARCELGKTRFQIAASEGVAGKMNMNQLLFASLFLFFTVHVCVAQKVQDREPHFGKPPKLNLLHEDRFASDTRADYLLDEKVVWKKGSLRFDASGSISFEINPTEWSQSEFTIGFPLLPNEDDTSVLQFWWESEESKDICLEIGRQRKNNEIVSTASLYAGSAMKPNNRRKILRQRNFMCPQEADLVFTYRGGLFSLKQSGQTVFEFAFASVGEEIPGFIPIATRLLPTKETVLKKLAFYTTNDLPSFSRDQQRLLSKADRLHNQVYDFWVAGNSKQALPLAKEVLEIRKQVLGKYHFLTANSHLNLAAQLKRTGTSDIATKHYEACAEISRKTSGERHPSYGVALNNLGLHLFQIGKYTKAEPLMLQARSIFRDVLKSESNDFGRASNNLGMLYRSTGDLVQSEQMLLVAKKIFGKTYGKTRREYGTVINNLANLYRTKNQFLLAERLYLESKKTKRETVGENHPSFGALLWDLGILYRDAKRFQEAEECIQKALDIFERRLGETHPYCLGVKRDIISIYVSKGDLALASAQVAALLKIMEAEHGVESSSYNRLRQLAAEIDATQGEFESAERLLKESLAYWAKSVGTEHVAYASCLNLLALTLEDAGELTRAEPLLVQSEKIYTGALGDLHRDAIASRINLASFYLKIADYQKAFSLLNESLGLIRASKEDNFESEVAVLNRLGMVALASKDWKNGLEHLESAERLARERLGEEHPYSWQIGSNLSQAYLNSGDYDKGLQAIRKSRESLSKRYDRNSRKMYVLLNNEAELLRLKGDYEKALEGMLQSNKIAAKIFGKDNPAFAKSCNNLAACYHNLGKFERSRKLWLASQEIVRKQLDETSVLQSERLQKQMELSQRAFLDNLVCASLVAKLDQRPVVESLWRWKGAVTLRQSTYRTLSRRPEIAPLFEEFQRINRKLSVHVGVQPTSPPKYARPSEVKSLQKRQNEWNDEFALLRKKQEALQVQIAAKSSAFRLVNDPLQVAEVQQALKGNEAFVDFIRYRFREVSEGESERVWVDEPYFAAFVIRPGHEPALVQLDSAGRIEKDILLFRTLFQNRAISTSDKSASREAATRLRKAIWKPIEKHLTGVNTVILSPDSMLGMLPYDALPGKKPGSYLIEDYKLAMIPMASFLRVLGEPVNSAKTKGLLAVGKVDYDSNDTGPATIIEGPMLAEVNRLRGGATRTWKSLPGFDDELEKVTSIFLNRFGRDAKLSKLEGADATESGFLKQAADYSSIHLVTHGFFEDESRQALESNPDSGLLISDVQSESQANRYLPGLLSGLVFAGVNGTHIGSGDDGILRATEIASASLQGVDLVVLSACETGLGKVAGGEGLSGLQRAFQVAGARSVLASLWQVDDKATTQLMERYYTNYWLKKMSKLDALHEAKLWMLRNKGFPKGATRGEPVEVDPARITKKKDDSDPAGFRTHPRYWASFVLSGDWR